MVCAVGILLERLPLARLVGGLYALSRPLRLVGVAPERLALRLLLVLRYVEASPRGQGRPTGDTGWQTSLRPTAAAEDAPVVLAREAPRTERGAAGGLSSSAVALLVEPGMKRIVLGLEYAGDAFCGWQVSQAHGRTVQDDARAQLAQIASEPCAPTAPGAPTPACMRARRWRISTPAPCARPRPGCAVSAAAAAGRVVRWSTEVGDDFHARFLACERQLPLHPAQCADAGRRCWPGGWLVPTRRSTSSAWPPPRSAWSAPTTSQVFGAGCQAKTPVRVMHEARVVRQGNTCVRFPRQRLPPPRDPQPGRRAGVRRQGAIRWRGCANCSMPATARAGADLLPGRALPVRRGLPAALVAAG